MTLRHKKCQVRMQVKLNETHMKKYHAEDLVAASFQSFCRGCAGNGDPSSRLSCWFSKVAFVPFEYLAAFLFQLNHRVIWCHLFMLLCPQFASPTVCAGFRTLVTAPNCPFTMILEGFASSMVSPLLLYLAGSALALRFLGQTGFLALCLFTLRRQVIYYGYG